MVSQSQARRETNFEETEIVKDKNVSRGYGGTVEGLG